MSALKIALLGPPEVEHGDHRLTFPDRKVLALLAYLATEGGMQERQKLTRLLWPESDMAHGRTALRITLLHLRHMLEEDEREAHQYCTECTRRGQVSFRKQPGDQESQRHRHHQIAHPVGALTRVILDVRHMDQPLERVVPIDRDVMRADRADDRARIRHQQHIEDNEQQDV